MRGLASPPWAGDTAACARAAQCVGQAATKAPLHRRTNQGSVRSAASVGPFACCDELRPVQLDRLLTARRMKNDLHGTDLENRADTSRPGSERAVGNRGVGVARRDAQRAVGLLLALPPEPAALPAGSRRAQAVPYVFEHMALCSDRFIVTIDRAEGGGLEHRLYMAATDGLSDDEYLACIDVSSAPVAAFEPPTATRRRCSGC